MAAKFCVRNFSQQTDANVATRSHSGHAHVASDKGFMLTFFTDDADFESALSKIPLLERKHRKSEQLQKKTTGIPDGLNINYIF